MQISESVQNSIRLATVFPKEAILLDVPRQSKQQVIRQLAHHLVKIGSHHSAGELSIVEQILKREKSGTTALGDGFAFPNCLSAQANTFLGAIGISSEGIDFEAIDGELVRSIFLVIGPPQFREQHIELLGKLAALARDKTLRTQLIGCRTPEGVYHFLEEVDRNRDLNMGLKKGRRFL